MRTLILFLCVCNVFSTEYDVLLNFDERYCGNCQQIGEQTLSSNDTVILNGITTNEFVTINRVLSVTNYYTCEDTNADPLFVFLSSGTYEIDISFLDCGTTYYYISDAEGCLNYDVSKGDALKFRITTEDCASISTASLTLAPTPPPTDTYKETVDSNSEWIAFWVLLVIVFLYSIFAFTMGALRHNKLLGWLQNE